MLTEAIRSLEILGRLVPEGVNHEKSISTNQTALLHIHL